MTKLFRNIKFFLVWGINKVYSLKDLRLNTPIPFPTVILVLVSWFIFLTYFLLF